MSEKHLSSQFDAELSGISTRVLEMGGLVESQVAQAIYALTHFGGDVASQVLIQEERVNAMEMEIDQVMETGAEPVEWLERMPYVRAAFEEAMRLYPPAPSLNREAIADDSIVRAAVRFSRIFTAICPCTRLWGI